MLKKKWKGDPNARLIRVLFCFSVFLLLLMRRDRNIVRLHQMHPQRTVGGEYTTVDNVLKYRT